MTTSTPADTGDDTDRAEPDRESYHGYSVDDEDQPQSTGDSSADGRDLPEPLDEGYSPPEKWSAGQKYGNTPFEEEMGEPLESRLLAEEPEPDPYADLEGQENLEDGEVGAQRAGRLVAEDLGIGEGAGPEPFAYDVGIDGAGASAEEAAMHVIPRRD